MERKMFFYSDTARYDGPSVNVFNYKPETVTRKYLEHFDNYLFLNVLSKEGTFQERGQVEKELPICARKMKFWEQHPNFEAETVRRLKEQRIKEWKGRV
jgi:hypothetical protein